MNFLNRAKEQANKMNKGDSPLNNPFKAAAPAAPAVPGVKPSMPKVPGAPGTKPAVPGKPGVPGSKPMVPGAKPTIPGGKPAVPPVKAPVVEEKVEEKVEVVEETKVVETPAVEVKTETKVEATETKATEDPHAIANAVAAKCDEEINKEVEAVEAKKTTKKKSSRKKTTKAEPEVADTPSTVEIPEGMVMPTTELSYADAIASIKSSFVDEEWEEFRNKIQTTMTEIMITNEMNKAQVYDLLAQVSTLRDEISVAYTDTKTLYENLSSKEDGMIERVKKLNGKGSNAEERKLSGMLAAVNYKDRDGNAVNLFELLDETRGRYNFLKNVMETIEFKKAVLLTMLSSLKSN